MDTTIWFDQRHDHRTGEDLRLGLEANLLYKEAACVKDCINGHTSAKRAEELHLNSTEVLNDAIYVEERATTLSRIYHTTGFRSWHEAAYHCLIQAEQEREDNCSCLPVGNVCVTCKKYYDFTGKVLNLLGVANEIPY